MPSLYPFTKNATKYVDVANASRITTSKIAWEIRKGNINIVYIISIRDIRKI
jgi:hypothetical protein